MSGFDIAIGVSLLVTMGAAGAALVLAAIKEKRNPSPEWLPKGELCEMRFPGAQRVIAARLRKVLEQVTGSDLSRLPPEGRLAREAGLASAWDSLEMVEAIMALEDEFGFELSDSELQRMNTFRDAVEIIASHALSDAKPSRPA